MKKSYIGSRSFLKSFSWPVLLVVSMLVFAFANAAIGQSVITVPSMKDNVVTMDAGGMLNITVPNTVFNQQYRIQRTFPSDRSFLMVTSNGGNLIIPPIPVTSPGTQIITIVGIGENHFAYSFNVEALPNSRAPATKNMESLFNIQNGGPNPDAPLAESITVVPGLVTNTATICDGGTVLVSIINSVSGITYRIQQSYENQAYYEDVAGNNGTVTFAPMPVVPAPVGDPIVTVYKILPTFGIVGSFNVHIVPQPTAPSLTPSPAPGIVCNGVNVSGSAFVAGSGGFNCTDAFEYRTNGGSWSTYTSGTLISTTGLTTVDIRAKRSDAEGRGCSAENVYSWTVTQITLTTSTTQTTCPLNNNGTATVTPSGGTWPYTYNWGYVLGDLDGQHGWNGGIGGFTNYSPGDADVVNTSAFNGTQSWYFKKGYNSPGQGSPFTPVVASVGAPGNGAAGNQSIIELSFKAAVLDDGSRITVYEGSVNRDDRTGANLYIENISGGLVQLYMFRSDDSPDYSVQENIGTYPANVWNTVKMVTDYPATNGADRTTWGTTKYYVNGTLVGLPQTTWTHWWRFKHGNAYAPGSSVKFTNNNAGAGFYIDDVSMIVNNTVTSTTVGTFSAGFEAGGQTTPMITNLTAGSYDVMVTDANGCTANATVIVTSDPTGPVHNTRLSKNYCNIQAAIDDPLNIAGDIITVDPGIYKENVIVNKSLDIQGPNYNITPNPLVPGPRPNAEAIIVPFSWNPGSGKVVLITASNVSFNGFTIDGDNPDIPPSGGNPIDARHGINAYEDGLTNVNIKYNIVQNVASCAIRMQQVTNYFATDSPATFSYNNTVENNKVDNAMGYGILCMNSMYAAVKDNVITNTLWGGIYFYSMRTENKGGSAYRVISGNKIQSHWTGIWFNLCSATPYEVSNNNMTAFNDASQPHWYGIMMSTVSGAQNFMDEPSLPKVATPEYYTFINNTIDGSGMNSATTGYGYWLYYVDDFRDDLGVDHYPTITDGSISNVEVGVMLKNEDTDLDTQFGTSSVGTHANIAGTSISVKPGGTGIYLKDDPTAVPGNPAPLIAKRDVKLGIGTGVTVNGGAKGLLMEYAAAYPYEALPTGVSNLAFTGQTGNYIELSNYAYNIDGTAVSFDGKTGAPPTTLAQNFAIEDKIVHKIDNAALGFVKVKNLNDFVTPLSGSIQRGIDAASNGWTVNVNTGIYPEHLIINKTNLTLLGVDKTNTIIDATQDPSWTVAKAGILIRGTGESIPGTSDNTVSGFTIRNAELQTGGAPFGHAEYGVGAGGMAGVQIYGSSGNSITGNIFEKCGYQVWVLAEWASAGYGNSEGNLISGNIIGNSVRHGVYLYSDGTVSVNNTTITGNDISDAHGNYSGIRFLGEGTSPITNTIIGNNNITGCSRGIRIADANVSGISIHNNSIHNNVLYGLQNELLSNIDATCNWWGTVGSGAIASMISGPVTYSPYLTDGTDDSPATGFQTSATCGTVTGLYVDDDSNTGDVYTPGATGNDANPGTAAAPFRTIQHAINAAGAGNTIYVDAGTYNEQVILNKAVSVLGAQWNVDPRGGRTGGESIIDGTGLTPTLTGLVRITNTSGSSTFDGFTIHNAPSVSGFRYTIWARGDDEGPVYPSAMNISHNILEGCGHSVSYDDYGLSSKYNKSNLLFSYNVISNFGGNVLLFELNTGPVEISHNNITVDLNCLSTAIFSMSYKDGYGNNNDVTGKQWLHHNNINANGETGISINSAFYGTNGRYTSVEIADNIITNVGDTKRGITLYVYDPTGGFVDPLIKRNTLSTMNPGTGTSRGIFIHGGVSVAQISDNNNISGFYQGIFAEGNANITITENDATIHNNTIGIDVMSNAIATIYRNTIESNGIGVRFSDGGRLNYCRENYIRSNTTDGVLIMSNAGDIGDITGNSITLNGGFGINDQKTAPAVTATCNWWDGGVNAVSGNVIWIPYLTNPADQSAVIPGFQPDLASCTTTPTAFYVNDAQTGGDRWCTAAGNDANTGTTAAPFRTIQHAINLASGGETIWVDAGTYIEDVKVNKQVKIYGTNYDLDPTTPAWTYAESVVQPFTNDDENGALISVEVSNVDLRGIAIDGDNPALSGGTYTVGGIDVDVSNGIQNGPTYGTYFQINHLNVANNKFRNFSYDGMYIETTFGVDQSWNTFHNNYFTNMWEGIQTYALQADISDNVFDHVNRGIGMHAVSVAADATPPGFVPKISHNEITIDWTSGNTNDCGIWVNYREGTAPELDVTNNTISCPPGSIPSGKYFSGLYVMTINGDRNVTFSGNTVNGNSLCNTGLYAANISSDNVKITGGSLNNIKENGVIADNYNEISTYYSTPAPVKITVDNVPITMGIPGTGTGVKAYGSPSGAGNLASVIITNDCSISGGADGILATGSGASVTVTGNDATITGNLVGLRIRDGGNLASCTGNTITDNTYGGIIVESTAGPTIGDITQNTISGNGYLFDALHGLGIDNQKTSITVNAIHNYWGSPSGPYNNPLNLCGQGNAVVGPVTFDPWYFQPGMTTVNSLPVVTIDPIADISTIIKTPVVISATAYYPSTPTNIDPSIVTDARISTTLLGGFPAGCKIIKVSYWQTGYPTPIVVTTNFTPSGNSFYLSDILPQTLSLLNRMGKTVICQITVTGANAAVNIPLSVQFVTYINKAVCVSNIGSPSTFNVAFGDVTFSLSPQPSASSCNNSITVTSTNTYPAIINIPAYITGDSRIHSDISIPAGTIIDWTYTSVIYSGSGSTTLGAASNNILLSTIIGPPSSLFYLNGATGNSFVFTVHGAMLEGMTFNLSIDAFANLDGTEYVYHTDYIKLEYFNIPVLLITNPDPVCNTTVDLTAPAVTAGSDLPTTTTLTYWTNAGATNPLVNYTAVAASGTYYIKATTTPGGCSDIEAVVVTIDPLAVGGTIDPPKTIVCLSSNTGTLTLSGYTSTIVTWENSINNGASWVGIGGTAGSTTYTYTNITHNTMYRVLIHSASCPTDVYSTIATVYTGVISTAGSPTVCSGATIDVPITVTSFTDVESITLKLKFLTTDLVYSGVTAGPVSWLTFPPNPNVNTSTGIIKVTGFGAPVSLPDNTVLFTLHFTQYSGFTGTTTVTFQDPPLDPDPASNEYSTTMLVPNPPGPDVYALAPFCDAPIGSYYFNSTITVTPTVTINAFSPATHTRCQGAGTETNTTTGNNTTGITYSLDAASLLGGNTINLATGTVTYVATWSGTTTITASAAGCNGPATTDFVETVTPTVTIAAFSPATGTRCQGAGTVTNTTTAYNNSAPIVYSLDAASLSGGNTINSSTGAVTYVATWSGTTTITASAAGCNGPATTDFVETITPTVTINAFSPATHTRCQGAGTEINTTTGNNTTGITYSLDAASLAGGNTIIAATGVVTYVASWSGTSTITASAAGCNGPATTDFVETITPTVTIDAFSPATGTRCQGAGIVTNTTTAHNNSAAIVYSLDAASLLGGNTINSATGAVTYVATWSGTTTITASAAGCNGPATTDFVETVNPSQPVSVLLAADATTVCIGTTVNFTATPFNGGGAPTYAWYLNGGLVPLITGPTYSLVAADGDQVYVILTSNITPCPTGNPATSSPITITVNSATITGVINYYNTANTPLNNGPLTGNMVVKLFDGLTDVYTATIPTGSNTYTFSNVCPGSYTVHISTTKGVGGVNATDAGQVNSWGVTQYPIQMVRFYAGDLATFYNHLDGNDASAILGYFLTGTLSSLRGPWTFWKTDDPTSTNPVSNPTALPVMYTPLTVPSGSGITITQNFYGLVTGDFNRSHVPSLLKSASTTLSLTYGDTKVVKAGTEFDLPITTGSAIDVGAVSLIMNFPSDKLEIVGVNLADKANTPVMYNVSGDELRIGWTSLNALSLKAADKLLTLRVKLIGSLGKDETIRFTLAEDQLNELADGRYDVIPDAVLNIDILGAKALGIDPAASTEALWFTNYPNPFIGTTTLAYSLPVAGDVTIELRNMLGVLVKTIVNKAPQASGDHKLILNAQELPEGVYMATLVLKSGGQPMMRTIKIVSNH